MTAAETQFILTLAVYGLATGCSLFVGYLAFRKHRPHRPRFLYHHERGARKRGIWG
jgi:hypothetical protein